MTKLIKNGNIVVSKKLYNKKALYRQIPINSIFNLIVQILTLESPFYDFSEFKLNCNVWQFLFCSFEHTNNTVLIFHKRWQVIIFKLCNSLFLTAAWDQQLELHKIFAISFKENKNSWSILVFITLISSVLPT